MAIGSCSRCYPITGTVNPGPESRYGPNLEGPRPENVRCGETVGLHLLVKNGSGVVGRLLDCVGPYLHEVVAVLNDCTDETAEVIAHGCRRHRVRRLVQVAVTPETHPGLYFRDEAESYAVGQPCAGEVFDGPFTGSMMLADWAAARNVGWRQHESDWRLILDADDLVRDPQSIPGLVQLLSVSGFQAASSAYDVGDPPTATGARERLCRNTPDFTWTGCVHERLTTTGIDKVAHVAGSLVVVDVRDSRGAGTRVPLRNLKVLYRAARASGWQLTTRDSLCLASEARYLMPDLCENLLSRVLADADSQVERAWACAVMGDLSSVRGDRDAAVEWYERANAHCKSRRCTLKIAREHHNAGRIASCSRAYDDREEDARAGFFDLGGVTEEEVSGLLLRGAP